jgi:hypothetical protein
MAYHAAYECFSNFSCIDLEMVTLMANEYAPHHWVVVKLPLGSEGHFYRVMGGWRGGYVGGDSWRMSSRIMSVEKQGPLRVFYGETGSIYYCHTATYGMKGMYLQGILNDAIHHGAIALPEEIDWQSLDYK